jgi:hypothetical protein
MRIEQTMKVKKIHVAFNRSEWRRDCPAFDTRDQYLTSDGPRTGQKATFDH